jgi:hypothetical protein
MTAASALLFNEMIHGGNNKSRYVNEKNPLKTSLAVMHIVEGTGLMICSGTLPVGMFGAAGFPGFFLGLSASPWFFTAGCVEFTHGWNELTGNHK